MSDLVKIDLDSPERQIKLVLIDPDPIFRTGLRVVLEQFWDLKVLAEADNYTAALEIVSEIYPRAATTLFVVVLELQLHKSQPSLGLQLCQQIKTQYPKLPILLLSSIQEPTQLTAARAMGVEGYCPKGISLPELVAVIRQVAAGEVSWGEQIFDAYSIRNNRGVLAKLRDRLRLSGLRQIDLTLAEVTAQLQIPGLPLLDQAFLAGQRRELLAARWLVNQLLGAAVKVQNPTPEVKSERSELPNSKPTLSQAQLDSSSKLNIKLPSTLFTSTLTKLQYSLDNLTSEPLEIDIFRPEKKRELLLLILQQVEIVLQQLRFSQVQLHQLPQLKLVVLRDLWQISVTDFFGKYSTLKIGDRNLEIANILLQDATVVQTDILNEIPLVVDLLGYLLFETPLIIDNISYASDTPEAIERAEIILENLLIQIANAVVQPLLNRLGDLETIKQNFYDRRLITTREIEKFRNNLSWKYQLRNYIGKPKAIFESRYDLFVLVPRGIAKTSIYAPRSQELTKLSGVPLVVTLALEARDAIAPRLRAAVSFIGSGVVYLLTQVIGRAIGLIGRGILQGIKSR